MLVGVTQSKVQPAATLEDRTCALRGGVPVFFAAAARTELWFGSVLRKLRVGAFLVAALAGGLPTTTAVAAIFTVTNTAQTGPGSLRQAVLDANLTNDTDRIVFNIPGTGPHVILVKSVLDTLASPVEMDGYTQPGATNNTLANGNNAVIRIQLSGAEGDAAYALKIGSPDCAVRGLSITGFKGDGLVLDSQSDALVEGNFIGLDPDGVTVAPNQGAGISCTIGRGTIGGPAPQQRNVIAGNLGGGIVINNSGNNTILGNYLGTDASGRLARGNTGPAIRILSTNSTGNQIGGAASGEGNVIAASTGTGTTNYGIYISNAGTNRVEGNFIGTDATGTNALGNAGSGIHINNGKGMMIGGTAPGAGNVIAFNTGAGVSVPTTFSTNNAILANSIHANGGLGIDLGLSGVSTNDLTDLDGGANNLQNFPVLTLVTHAGGRTLIEGYLESRPSKTYRLEFFANAEPDASGHGEGQIFLGATNLTLGASNRMNFALTLDTGDLAGQHLTATATDPYGNTSEFSETAPVLASSPWVVIQPVGQAVAVGDAVTMSVQATGALPLYYQWLHDGVALPGATSATLTFNPVKTSHAGVYTVVVTNLDGTTISEPATLTVLVPTLPVLVSQPLSQSVSPGDSVEFSVVFSGVGPFSVQWRLNGVNIEGATNLTLALPNVQATNSGTYSVVVSTDAGAVNSANAVLTVQLPALGFKDNIASLTKLNTDTGAGRASNTVATVQAGEPLHAGKSGGKSMWIMWQAPRTGIASFNTCGSTFDTLLAVYVGTAVTDLVEVASDDDSGGFHTSAVKFNATSGRQYLIAVDGFGGADGDVVLNWSLEATAQVLPLLVTHPSSQTVVPGGTALLEVSTTGTGLTYQWFHNGVPISGAVSSQLVVAGIGSSQVGKYHVRVSNGTRTNISRVAMLELNDEIATGPPIRTANKFLDGFGTSLTP